MCFVLCMGLGLWMCGEMGVFFVYNLCFGFV